MKVNEKATPPGGDPGGATAGQDAIRHSIPRPSISRKAPAVPWTEPHTHRTDIGRLEAFNVAATFDVRTLRQLQHNAEVNRSVARNFGDELAEDLWDWSAELARLAIHFRRYRDAIEAAKRPRRRSRKIDYDAIKEQHDIVDFAGRYTKLRKSGRRYIGLCPLHRDRHPSFVVYETEQRFRCFGCGAHGDVIDLAKALGRDLVEEVRHA